MFDDLSMDDPLYPTDHAGTNPLVRADQIAELQGLLLEQCIELITFDHLEMGIRVEAVR